VPGMRKQTGTLYDQRRKEDEEMFDGRMGQGDEETYGM